MNLGPADGLRLMRKLRRRYGPRRFHAFAIGPGKSGTTSLAQMFARDFRSAHEPNARELIDLLLGDTAGDDRERALLAFIRDQDRLGLEMNASSLNTCVVELLVREFPHALFILAVRDCVSWTNSAINQLINRRNPSDHHRRWRIAEFGERSEMTFAPEEAVLKERGLWPLSSYLSLWRGYYERALQHVPPNRLLVLRTRDLSSSTDRLCDFLGISADRLNESEAHSHETPEDHRILLGMDHGFLKETFEKHCGALMQTMLPNDPLDVQEILGQ